MNSSYILKSCAKYLLILPFMLLISCDGSKSNLSKKDQAMVDKLSSERDKTRLTNILVLLNSKRLDLCKVDKDLLSISSNARKTNPNNQEETETKKKAEYWTKNGLKGADSLSLQIAVFSMKVCR